jgi:hypothetical protein
LLPRWLATCNEKFIMISNSGNFQHTPDNAQVVSSRMKTF